MTNVLDTEIEQIDLTVRAYNVIRSLSREINTVGDLIKYTEEDLMKAYGSTPKSLREIKETLISLGLNLKSKKVNMKLEIIKEEQFGEPTWYFLRADDSSVKCSKDLKEIEDAYDELINNPDLIVLKKTILKSQEISVNLQ